MSTTEEQEVAEVKYASPDPPRRPQWAILLPVGAFGIAFLVHLFIGWIVFPKLLYSEKQQPIDFNHVLHVEEMGDCEGCHTFRDDGSFTGVPGLSNCLECHEEAMGEHPDEVKLVDEYVSQEKEIPWLIYSRQPDCVFFSHAAHVKMAELECKTCHGLIEETEDSRPYFQNRLTTYSRDIWGREDAGLIAFAGKKTNSWDSMKMNDCAECHRDHGTNNACFVCHK